MSTDNQFYLISRKAFYLHRFSLFFFIIRLTKVGIINKKQYRIVDSQHPEAICIECFFFLTAFLIQKLKLMNKVLLNDNNDGSQVSVKMR